MTVPLGSVTKWVRGINFKPEDVVPPDDPGAVACMRTKNVQAELDLTDVWGVASSFVRRSEQYLKQGDILVSSANSWNLVGKCSWVPQLRWPTTFGGFVGVLRADPNKVDARYLYRWFSSDRVQRLLRSFGQKTTSISNLNVGRCLALEFPALPIEEQRRIASVLDAADALRATRRQAIAKLATLRNAVVWQGLAEYRERSPLGDHLDFVTSGSRGWARYYSDHGKRFIRTQDVLLGSIDNESPAYVTPPDNAESRRTEVREGDVLVTITGIVGRVAAVPAELDGSFISQHVAVARPSKTLRAEFIEAFMCSALGQRQIDRMQYGQTKPGLNLTQIREFQLPVPSIQQQEQLIERLQAVHIQANLMSNSAVALDALFASLQHRAFSGEL